jgi:predicted amidohydrolase YtcJ
MNMNMMLQLTTPEGKVLFSSEHIQAILSVSKEFQKHGVHSVIHMNGDSTVYNIVETVDEIIIKSMGH